MYLIFRLTTYYIIIHHNSYVAVRSALKGIDHVLRLCENHLSDGSEAVAHYRNVCRALVSEALELSSFLEKAWHKKNGDDGEFREELQELALRDWVIYRTVV